MTTTERSTNNSHQPHYAKRSGAAKAAVALVAVLVSSTLLGGMLGLFEMRYFGGYTEVETAEALALTERTIRRDWDKARLLLSDMLKG